MIVPRTIDLVLNDTQKEGLRRLARWSFSSLGEEFEPVHHKVMEKFVRIGFLHPGNRVLTNAGLAAAALLDEIDELKRINEVLIKS